MGKTALALEIMRRMARNNLPSGIISLETSHTNLGYRLLSQTSGIPAHQILNAQLSQNELDKLMKAASQLSELGIVIDDSVGLSVTKLRAKARQMKQKHNISALFIDYVQLLQAEGYNRENQVANISRACKAVAKELDIPVIALAQLSRDLEKRGGDKRPIMSDLRESGQLEQDADVIMFLHRPEYYGVATDALGNSTEGICEVIVAKNKEGKTGVKNLEFDKERMMFSNLDPIMHKAKPKKDQTLTDTTINDYSPF